MAFKKRRSLGQQPQGRAPLAGFTPDILWYDPLGAALHDGLAAGTFTGTSTASKGGKALAHNGSSQRENWVLPDIPNAYPLVLAGSFVVTETSTGVQTAFGLGGATLSNGNYTGVGQYTANRISSWARMAPYQPDASIDGPTAVVGQRYNVIRISRSATDHVMYVNGVRYTGSTDSKSASDSWRNATVGACVRNTTPILYGKQTVHMGFAAFTDPGDDWARQWSLDENFLFAPRSKLIGGAAGGGGTDVGLSTETDTSLALSALQIKATGTATETDAALALAPVQIAATGRADETNTAFALTPVQVQAVGLATETDTALALDAGAASAAGLALETDTALALAAVQITATGIATEVDTALALTGLAGTAPGIASETDTAFALAAVQKLVAGAALEVDTALALSAPGGTLDLILKILVNRQELNPATGTFTLYDNDGTTVLYTTSAWADVAGTVPYSGGALRRIDALF